MVVVWCVACGGGGSGGMCVCGRKEGRGRGGRGLRVTILLPATIRDPFDLLKGTEHRPMCPHNFALLRKFC